MCLVVLTCAAPILRGQEHSTPGIPGEITGPKALKWLFGNYDAVKRQSESGGAFVQVYRTQNAVVNGERQWFLYTWENEATNTCHGCQGTLGAAMFAKQGQYWVEKSHDGGLDHIGSYGLPQGAKPVQWGAQSYGLVVDNGFTQAGFSNSFQLLYGFEDGSFRRIFEIALSNQGGVEPYENNWEAKWTFGPPGLAGVFDVVVKMVSQGKLAEGFPVPGIYRYDGKVYRHFGTHKELGEK